MIKLKKGFNIKLNGKAQKSLRDVIVSSYSVQPKNFNGLLPIPKLLVAEGDSVKAGTPLFFDKKSKYKDGSNN